MVHHAVQSILICFLLLPSIAFACDCHPQAYSVIYSAKHSERVLKGKFVPAEGDCRTTPEGRLSCKKFRVEVEKVWKGPAEPVVDVYTGAPGTSCESSLSVGYTYILFLYREKQGLVSSQCSADAYKVEKIPANSTDKERGLIQYEINRFYFTERELDEYYQTER